MDCTGAVHAGDAPVAIDRGAWGFPGGVHPTARSERSVSGELRVRADHACILNCCGRREHDKIVMSSTASGRGSAWLERLVRDQEVGGSNPLAPTITFQ